jgi:hypothetical protein
MKWFLQSASTLLGFIQMGLGSLATIFIGVLNIKTVLPLAAGIMICSLLELVVIVSTKKNLLNRPMILQNQFKTNSLGKYSTHSRSLVQIGTTRVSPNHQFPINPIANIEAERDIIIRTPKAVCIPNRSDKVPIINGDDRKPI